MGISASQVRLLQLTQRDHDIKGKLIHLSDEKMSLANDMLKVSQKYQQALNTKALKWTNNAGADYINISYAGLMRPSAANNYSLYMLTDLSGRVVVDDRYKQFAALISPDGSPGGDWELNRDQIMSQVLSISSSDIHTGYENMEIFDRESANVDYLNDHKPDPNGYGFAKHSTSGLLTEIGGDWGNYATDTAEYTSDQYKAKALELLDAIKEYYPEDVVANFKYDDIKNAINGTPSSDNKYTKKQIVEFFTSILKGQHPELVRLSNNGNHDDIIWYDTTHSDYQQYQNDLQEWTQNLETATRARDDAKVIVDSIFSPDVRSQMAFYEKLFTSIAEKGWKAYPGVTDEDYLNQMLQNNMFSITSVERDYVEGMIGEDGRYENTYITDMPLNNSHIVQVNDSDIRDKALVEYEHEKRVINAKETKIDTRMKNLETEQEAIKQMIESVTKVKDNNIENTFNIFG